MAGEHAADAAMPDAEPGGAAQGTTPGAPGGVDYERMAADWDRGQAVMAPVTGAVLARLPALAAGDLLLDVGCGTGEPGLSAARRGPGVRLLGVDTAAAMVEVARHRTQQEQLAATFEVMAAGELTLADGSVGRWSPASPCSPFLQPLRTVRARWRACSHPAVRTASRPGTA